MDARVSERRFTQKFKKNRKVVERAGSSAAKKAERRAAGGFPRREQ